MKRTQRHARKGRTVAGAIAAITLVGSGLAAVAVPAQAAADEPALDWSNYERTTITRDVGEPIGMTILPDNKIIHTARNGEVRLTDPATGITKVVNKIDVYANSEDGLQGIAIDPNFADNGWVYLVYSPRDADGDGVTDTPPGSAPQTLPTGEDESYWDRWLGVNRLSRFQWTGEGLDLSTEQAILDVEVQRGQCCHVGADIDFDGEGNLYLSTGDNTPAGTPGANGYAPNNDAPNMNPGFDARRSSGNTNDLRGKILRITVQEDGSYTIPEGNLFPPGTPDTRPEIFIMGVRNPFRIDVDAETNTISYGDYGPDAAQPNPNRGPMGYVEWNISSLDDPHNAGWPFCHGPNAAYNEWDFATATPGEWFDCDNLVNNSRWNTGLTELPPSRAATLHYGDDPGHQPWDELVNFGSGRGQGPMGGPAYHFDAANPSTSKLPEYWDGKWFFGEFSQDYIAAFTVNDALEVTAIEDFMPNAVIEPAGLPRIDNPIDLEFGPDGALYVLEYGDGFFRANPDAGLHRIAYAQDNRSPQARLSATPHSSSTAPLTVQFDASRSTDPEGQALTYEWDFDGNGTFDATGVQVTHTYTDLGIYTARLRVADTGGKLSLATRTISVGNTAPEVTVEFPANGGFFQWGDQVPFRVTTHDAEDGDETVCSRVRWTYGLGHDEHAHPEVSGTGCTGVFRTDPNSPQHGDGANLYGAVVVTYTDAGANGLPPAAGEATVRLNPFLQEAEFATSLGGGTVVEDAEASAGRVVRVGSENTLRWDPVSFVGIDDVLVRAQGSGRLELRYGSPTAKPFGTAVLKPGDGWKDVTVQVAGKAPTEPGALYVTVRGEAKIDSLTFRGVGVAQAP